MSKLKKSLFVMAIVSIAIVLLTTAFSVFSWRNSMIMPIDANANFVFCETDITDTLNYMTVTNTYLLGFVFSWFGFLAGTYMCAILWMLYGFVLLSIKTFSKICKNRKSQRYTIK